MANDRNRSDEQYSGPTEGRQGDSKDEPVRGGVGDEVRGTSEEGDEELEDLDDLEESEEESDGSF